MIESRQKVSLYISQKECIGCELCVEVCPRKVLGMTYRDTDCYASVEFLYRCSGCNKCVSVCPMQVIELGFDEN